jgi:peroxisomal 3,2-trans-enoyl-CoA isomerase
MEDPPTPFGSGSLRVCRRGKDNGILLVALSKAPVRNAINDHVYDDLIGVLQLATNDGSLSAVVLTGSGEFFSSGADLKGGTFSPEEGGRRTLRKPAGRFMLEVIAFPKILAAAVNGPAVGIAVTLLMHCDLVHCSSRATFWAPFTRLALVPELCSSVTFLETIGLAKANEMLLLAREINANTAVDWGISSRIVPNCDDSGDPFHPNSLASRLCSEIDERLLQLPKGRQTAQYFVSMIRGRRRHRLSSICRQELLKLDERFDSGDVQYAARGLLIGSGVRQRMPLESKL